MHYRLAFYGVLPFDPATQVEREKKLVKAGKVANQSLLMRGLCWFLGV